MFYKTFGREVASVLLRAGVVIFSIIFIFGFVTTWYESPTISDGVCNIAVLPIEGVILPFTGYDDYPLVTTPGTVRDFVSGAEADTAIQGILVEINSPGGTPVASEQISSYISESSLPSVSLIGDVGASGGYLVAVSADTVIASAMSDVGSIGVTMSYLESSKKNEEDGLTFVELSSGKFKDAGNPDKPLTEEERALFQEDIDLIHDEFVKQIAAYRGREVWEIEALADGAAMPGLRALEKGLVDQIGGRKEAKEYFSATLGIDIDSVVFCEYTPPPLFY
jgi:protease IV